MPRSGLRLLLTLLVPGLALVAGAALAHGVAGEDQAFMLRSSGPLVGPYIYLGAKHMVTGYDHVLFLAGGMFFL